MTHPRDEEMPAGLTGRAKDEWSWACCEAFSHWSESLAHALGFLAWRVAIKDPDPWFTAQVHCDPKFRKTMLDVREALGAYAPERGVPDFAILRKETPFKRVRRGPRRRA